MITAVDYFKMGIRVPGLQQIADVISRRNIISTAGYYQF
jgi:hypothetical protein